MKSKILATVYFSEIAVVSVAINIWFLYYLGKDLFPAIKETSKAIFEDKFSFNRPFKNLLIAGLFYMTALYSWGLMSGIFFTSFKHPHPLVGDWFFAIVPMPFVFILGGFVCYPLLILSFWLFGKYWAHLRNGF